MPSRFLIYALTDPDGAIRYIGKSSAGMKRPLMHKRESRRGNPTHKKRWIKQLLSAGLSYRIVVLGSFETGDGLSEKEQWAIAWARSVGCRLTNATDGGEGVAGLVHSPEARAKMRAAQSNRTMEHRRAIGDGNRGKKATVEQRQKLSTALKAHAAKPEARERLRTLRLGATNSASAREKLRAANLGLKHSQERRAKNAEVHRGVTASAETRAKMSASQKRARPASPPIERECPRCSSGFMVPFPSSDRRYCKPCTPIVKRENAQRLPRGRRAASIG